MKKPGHPIAIAFACAVGVCSARAAGVAVLKEQTFHSDASARPVVYSRIIDSHGPYLRVVSGGANIDILRSKLVARVELPDGIPASIMEEKDLVPVRETLAAVKEFTTRYPRSAPMLEKQATALATHVSRFEAGDVRFEGTWISKAELAGILETRRNETEVRARETEARERGELEKWIFETAQREKGLVPHDGKWVTIREIEQRPPESPTELSDALEPLWNGDLAGAKSAVGNLTALASRQNGAPKVRTERLLASVRLLFLAESRLTQRMIAGVAEAGEAARHDRNVEKWLKPNAFGTVNMDAASDSRGKAREIRRRSTDQLDQRRQELLEQLRENDILTAEFHKLREHRVALILGGAVRAVAARHFTAAEFQPTFPYESLAAIRERIRSRDAPTAP